MRRPTQLRGIRITQVANPPAQTTIRGQGLRVATTERHPAGVLRGGGYDPETNSLYFGGAAGHPRGMAQGGGDPSKPNAAGVSLFQRVDGTIFWANDSGSLPRRLLSQEVQSIQYGLEVHFTGAQVIQLDRIGNVSK